MEGSLIIEKMNDPMLRQQWESKLIKLARALSDLQKARQTMDDDPTRMVYFEAVTRFAEARDAERVFYWEHFYEARHPSANESSPASTK